MVDRNDPRYDPNLPGKGGRAVSKTYEELRTEVSGKSKVLILESAPLDAIRHVQEEYETTLRSAYDYVVRFLREPDGFPSYREVVTGVRPGGSSSSTERSRSP